MRDAGDEPRGRGGRDRRPAEAEPRARGEYVYLYVPRVLSIIIFTVPCTDILNIC